MRHLTAIIAALMLLSLPAGWALAENKGKKMELTEQEMDAVTAAGPALPPGSAVPPLLLLPPGPVLAIKIQTLIDKIAETNAWRNFVDTRILPNFELKTWSTDPLKINGKVVTFFPLAVNGVPVFHK